MSEHPEKAAKKRGRKCSLEREPVPQRRHERQKRVILVPDPNVSRNTRHLNIAHKQGEELCDRVGMDVSVAVRREHRVARPECIRADDEGGEHSMALVSVRLRKANALPVRPSPRGSSLMHIRKDMVPRHDMRLVLALARGLREPHLEELPARRRAAAHRLDRLPVLLGVHDGEEDGEVDDEPLVLGEGLAERGRHVEVGAVVAVDDADDVFDGMVLSLETLQTLREGRSVYAASTMVWTW